MPYVKPDDWVANKHHKMTRRARPGYAWKRCDTRKECEGHPLTLASFASNASKADGLRPTCKDCEAAYRRENKSHEKRIHERYKLTSGRIGHKKHWSKQRAERLAKFRESGVYERPGRKEAEWRVNKDKYGRGRIKGRGKWLELKQLIF